MPGFNQCRISDGNDGKRKILKKWAGFYARPSNIRVLTSLEANTFK